MPICGKCNSEMEELQEDYENMSEAQEADYVAGLWGIYYCPKCKTQNIMEGDGFSREPVEYKNPANVEAGKKGCRTMWSNQDIKGKIAEEWMRNKLRDEGFKVAETMRYDSDKEISILNVEGVEKLLSEYSDKKKIIEILKEVNSGLPDLICLKNNKVSFVEVKSNVSQIKPHQMNAINKLKEMSFTVSVRRVKVDFNAEEINENNSESFLK